MKDSTTVMYEIYKTKVKNGEYVFILGDIAMEEFKKDCEISILYPSGGRVNPFNTKYAFKEVPVLCENVKQNRDSVRLYKLIKETK